MFSKQGSGKKIVLKKNIIIKKKDEEVDDTLVPRYVTSGKFNTDDIKFTERNTINRRTGMFGNGEVALKLTLEKRQVRRYKLRKRRKWDHIQKRRCEDARDGSKDNKTDDQKEFKITDKFKKEILIVKNTLNSDDEKKRMFAITFLHKLVSTKKITNPPIDFIHKIGILKKVCELMHTDGRIEVKIKCSWVLLNLSNTRDPEHVKSFVKLRVPQYFKMVLDYITWKNHPNNRRKKHKMDGKYGGVHDIVIIPENLIWTLANLVDDCVEVRDAIVNCGAVDSVLSLLRTRPHKSIQRFIARLVYVMFSFKKDIIMPNKKRNDAMHKKLLNVVKFLIQLKDIKMVMYGCKAISRMLDFEKEVEALPDEIKNFVYTKAVLTKLIQMLDSSETKLQKTGINLLCELISGEDERTKLIIKMGIIDKTIALLNHESKDVRKDAMTALVNVACIPPLIKSLFKANIIPTILKKARTEVVEVRIEAQYCVLNIFMVGSSQEVDFLIKKYGGLNILLDILKKNNATDLDYALEACEKILERGDILRKTAELPDNPFVFHFESKGVATAIENIQNFNIPKLTEKAQEILEAYFETEEETIDFNNTFGADLDVETFGKYDFGGEGVDETPLIINSSNNNNSNNNNTYNVNKMIDIDDDGGNVSFGGNDAFGEIKFNM